MGEMRVMGRPGDTKIIWDPHRDEEVREARATFDNLRSKGYLAFKVDPKGDKGEQITRFDPNVEKLILAPPMRGG